MTFRIDPDNKPVSRPGAYLVRNTINGKCYVGISQNILRRRSEHQRWDGTAPLLSKAVKKYGAAAFEFVPLFYSIDGTAGLPLLEASLIIEYGSLVPDGYNVQASSGAVGPYGPAFGEILRAAFANPEYKARQSAAQKVASQEPTRKAKMAAIAQRPEVIAARSANLKALNSTPAFLNRGKVEQTPEFVANRVAKAKITKANPAWKERVSSAYSAGQLREGVPEKKSAAIRAAMDTPEFKAWRSETSKAIHTPEMRKRKGNSVRKAFSNPEVQARHLASVTGRRLITNGVIRKWWRPGKEMPVDFYVVAKP